MYKTQRVYDSVWVKEQVKGDTVRIDRWHRTHTTDTLCVTDTLWMVKCDTVRVPVPVERKVPWWERRVKARGEPFADVCGAGGDAVLPVLYQRT